MRSLALGRTFDGIVAWDSFFHLTWDDQRRIFPVFRAHAATGAALMFTSGPDASLHSAEYRDFWRRITSPSWHTRSKIRPAVVTPYG